MVKCPICGNEVADGAKFCTSCGAQMGPADVVPTSQPPQPPAQQPGGIAPGGPRVPPPIRPPVQTRKMSRGVKTAIIVGCIFLILVVVTIVVVSIVLVDVLSGPADVANEYIREINEGDLEDAYYLLSEETKETTGRSEFEDKVGPMEGKVEKWSTTSIEIEDGRAVIVMELKWVDGTEDAWRMFMLKEEGEWKVHGTRGITG